MTVSRSLSRNDVRLEAQCGGCRRGDRQEPHRLIGHNDASLSQQLMTAMSQDRRLAQEYVENFSRPDRQWERFGSSERIRDWLDETRTQALRLAAVTANS
jgi:hypothetical protein